MSDTVQVDNPTNGDYTVSTDDAGVAGHVQRVKLAYSADGSATHVDADVNGLKVQLGAAIPAGTNNIGDVDVLSIVPGTGATNLGKAEDAVHASGDTGVMALGVAATTSASRAASGDYVALDTDVNGRQRVIGAVAQDAAVAGDVVLVGGRASAAVPTAMSADGDAVYGWNDRSGRRVVAQKSGTATSSNVAGSATSVTLLASNTSRLGATFYNDSTAILYLKLGATASSSSFTAKLYPEDYFEAPYGYTGVVDGIWASATGNCRVVELT